VLRSGKAGKSGVPGKERSTLEKSGVPGKDEGSLGVPPSEGLVAADGVRGGSGLLAPIVNGGADTFCQFAFAMIASPSLDYISSPSTLWIFFLRFEAKGE